VSYPVIQHESHEDLIFGIYTTLFFCIYSFSRDSFHFFHILNMATLFSIRLTFPFQMEKQNFSVHIVIASISISKFEYLH